MRGNSFQQAGPANEGAFFQQAGVDLYMRGDFLTGPGQVGKKEMSFPKAGPGYKKKRSRIILLVSSERQNKDEVFKPVDKSFIINLI